MGADVRTLQNICRDDLEAIALLEIAIATRQGERTDLRPIDNIKKSQADGTSTEYSLRRLRRQSPVLHAQVIAGEKSPNAAMIEAGFRKRTLTVPLEPDAAARTLKKHFTQAQIEEIISLLR